MMHQIVDVDDYFPDEIGTNSQAFMEQAMAAAADGILSIATGNQATYVTAGSGPAYWVTGSR